MEKGIAEYSENYSLYLVESKMKSPELILFKIAYRHSETP